MQKISRYYHTIKPLKSEQILYRLKYRFFPVKALPTPSSEDLSANRWSLNAPQVGVQSLFENDEVCFLNKRAQIKAPQDWNDDAQHAMLWLYNLHYFDDLNSSGADQRYRLQKKFILKWIEENPPLHGNGWDPYPLSLRLVNWVKWCQFNQEYDVDILRSIEQQADALMAQLEFHILGNHLFANAKALVFVGCFLKGGRADDYSTKGLQLLTREVSEQFLADGGHFELSPMYHSILLWDLIDLYNLALVSKDVRFSSFHPEWKEVIERGLSWLSVMCHPDGDISFFNDAAFGIAPSPNEIFRFALSVGITTDNKTGPSITMLQDSGYSRLKRGPFTLIFDHAEVGPTYLPGHAHADTLSIELSLGRQRVFVNSGTSEYGTEPERQRQRSTAAHNTLFVKSQNSSDVWAGFRVGKRAHVSGVESEETNDAVMVRAEHDGFCHLVKGLTHTRKCTVFDNKVLIEDELGVSGTKPIIAHFHLHPDVDVETIDTHSVRLILASGETLLFTADEPVSVEKTTWHPEFGKSISSLRLVIVISGSYLTSELTLGS
ncbi:heparinase II/III family protein [Pseudidiomarina sp. CB1]|uniref:heparinase II/III family protein n=1 Tax=Pseudidiomarina sp. CB1 TaxID=2972484 RepID=UPI002163C3C7|nr:alginate lyase family protein [Pseudidiomarina sp. CB1]